MHDIGAIVYILALSATQFCMISSNQTIVKLKRALKDRSFPTDLEIILVNCSFDCDSAILARNEETIVDIESYVNENKHILKNTSWHAMLQNKHTIQV